VASLVLALTGVMAWSPSASAEDKPAAGETEKKMLDKLVFANGRVVQGEVLEETATQVTMMVHFGNLPPTKTTYEKAEILEIQRGVVDPTAATPAARTTTTPKKDDKNARVAVGDADPDAALIYLVEFKGTFGSDISDTPLRDMFRDVDAVFNDLVEVQTASGSTISVVDPAKRDKHIVVIQLDCGSDERMGFDGMWRAEEMGPIVEKETQEKHRKVVFWVKDARDGAAFFPWLTQDVYFHPDGKMWITKDLEKFNIGDKMVDAKQISLRMGHAHGWAIDGGYDNGPVILDAMALSSRWLCFRLENGEPRFLTREPTEEELRDGWEVLSDDGKGDNQDKNKLRFQNDQLILDARIAQLVGLSKGTAESVEDLAFALNVHRNYTEVENRGQKIFDAWVKAKEDAFTQINQQTGTLWRELGRIKVEGDYDDRKRARGQMIKILTQIRGVVTRFAEVWDPDGSFRSGLDIDIEAIKQTQQADKATNNS
jgi:hypothetical protein